jgi:hypothetical protein
VIASLIKLGFIGSYKVDMLLFIAKILAKMDLKVIIVDSSDEAYLYNYIGAEIYDQIIYGKDIDFYIGSMPDDLEKVYDVVNVKDNHNFIGNGFVVSNTGKSSAAIMLGREWCKLIGIKFNPERHIAYNNADVMNKIDTLNKFEPLIADESINFACLNKDAKIPSKIVLFPASFNPVMKLTPSLNSIVLLFLNFPNPSTSSFISFAI